MSTVKRIQSVVNACRVFEAVAAAESIGVSELAREVGLDKSGVQRLVITLNEAGWLQPTTGGPTRWQLSSKVLTMTRSTSVSRTLEQAGATIRALRDATSETVLLVAVQGESLVVVDVASSDATVASMARVGDVMPDYGASASAYAAALAPGATSIHGFAPGGDLDQQIIDRARIDGYAVYADKDVTSVGAAVLDAVGGPVAVVVVLIPDFRVTPEKVSDYADLVVAAAAGASANH